MKIIWHLILHTAVATQQSIKAYVLAVIDAQDVDIAADSGSNIAVDLDDEVLTLLGEQDLLVQQELIQ